MTAAQPLETVQTEQQVQGASQIPEDVYKRQLQGVVCRGGFCGFFLPQAFLLGVWVFGYVCGPVSYTHLDVYKRQAQGPQKCLLGSSPNPLYFGTNCPKVPVRCTVVCGPSLSFLGLIFTLVCYAEQMINIRFYCHGLSHLLLGLPVFCIKLFFLSCQLTAGFF